MNIISGSNPSINGEYYYIRNLQGDIIGLIDKNGTEVVSYTYDTLGKLISIEGSLKDTVGVKNPYRYRGYRYDTETGLYYLNARYYNPEWGRFINADGALGATGELLSYNMFAYCFNNPVNLEDPSGNWPTLGQILKAAATVAIGAVVVVAVVPSAGAVAAAAGIAAASLGATGAMVSGVMTAATIGTYAVAAGIGACALSDAGEQLSGTNIIRDKVLGGNQGAYDAIQAGLSVASVGIITVGATKPGYSGKSAKPSGSATEMHTVPRQGTAISQIEKLYKNKPGQFQRRFFDYKGNVSLDIDFTPHSKPGIHSNPHLHIWDNGRQTQFNIWR